MTPREALALVRKQRVVPFTDVRDGPLSFVHAVTGESVKGSWWGHPRGHEIFNLGNAVLEECVSVKLLGGKETLVHRSLFPALARVVTDDGWRRARVEALSKEARALLAAIERGERARVAAKPKQELRRALLAHADEEHTERGNHVTVLVSWSSFFAKDVLREAKKLSFDEALETLRACCGGAKSAL